MRPWAKADRDLLRRGDLTASVKLAYVVIVDDMRHKGQVAIGIRRLADQIGLHPNSVPKIIRTIEKAGLLVVERKGPGRRTRFILPSESATQDVALPSAQSATQTVAQRHKNSGASARQTVARPDQTLNQTRGERPPASSSRKQPKAKTAKAGSAHQELVRHFTDGWSSRRDGAKYVFANARDGEAVKVVLDAVDGDLDRARLIVDQYLDDSETYITDREHPLSLIQTRLSKYTARVARASATPSAPVEEHPLIRDARELFGTHAVGVHRRELDAIAERVEHGELADARVCAAMRSSSDLAAFVSAFKPEGVVTHAG